MKNITLDVKVFPIAEPQGNTMAFASIGVDELMAVRGIRVINGENGLFVSMPQSKDKDGKFHDIAFPLNDDLRKAMNKAILDKYTAEVGKNVKKPSLTVKITEGKQKAAAQPAIPRENAAKAYGTAL